MNMEKSLRDYISGRMENNTEGEIIEVLSYRDLSYVFDRLIWEVAHITYESFIDFWLSNNNPKLSRLLFIRLVQYLGLPGNLKSAIEKVKDEEFIDFSSSFAKLLKSDLSSFDLKKYLPKVISPIRDVDVKQMSKRFKERILLQENFAYKKDLRNFGFKIEGWNFDTAQIVIQRNALDFYLNKAEALGEIGGVLEFPPDRLDTLLDFLNRYKREALIHLAESFKAVKERVQVLEYDPIFRENVIVTKTEYKFVSPDAIQMSLREFMNKLYRRNKLGLSRFQNS